jgi:hypothetical protein
MKKILMFSLLIAVTSHVFAVPTITKSVSAGTTFKFTETLSEKLPTGYKVKIDLNNGKGLVAMTCSGTTCTLSSNALPKVDTSMYKVGIYDAKGVLQGTTTDGSYVIVSTVTTGYTKISNSGAVLSHTATLGNGENDWACTRDNKTGLTWEVKTDDGGLRDKDWYYSWYKPSGDNGGSAGYTDTTHEAPNCSTKDNCNTDAFTNAVNTKGLCGKNDWRMPTKDELMKLVVCSDGKYETDGSSCTNYLSVTKPTINSTYFPNTMSSYYWSSSPNANGSSNAWLVDFGSGNSLSGFKDFNFFVRLVR